MKRLLAAILALWLALCGVALAEETATVLDVTAPLSSTELTLLKPKLSGIKRLTEALSQFPQLQTVTLDHPQMTAKLMRQLREAMPQVHFVFLYRWFNMEINTDDTAVDFGNKRSIAYSDVCELLSLMPSLKQLDMYGVEISLKQMEKLMQAYPDVTFHWTVPVSGSRLRTDASAFSTKHSAESKRDDSAHYDCLKYVPALQALDLGHNAITELSFLRYFPTMRVLILADNKISDVTEIGKLTELEYAELFLNRIEDVRPLANLTNLKDLNLAHNNISDPTPLYALTQLKRLWISCNNLTDEQVAALRLALPNTEIVADTYWSTGAGWREHSHYYELISIFNHHAYVPLSDD